MAVPARNASAPRIAADARTFYVTSSTFGKKFILQSERAAQLFIRVLYEYRAQGKFRLHEFVVMPDHFHLLITVNGGMSIERAVQFVKGGFAFRAGKELGLRAPIWQRGFSEVRVSDAPAAEGISKYIRDNPVVAGLVSKASAYPFSSAHPGHVLDPLPLRLVRIRA
ncbi:MAG TPA: transposase [Terriglobales bacterium]|nr:transposase [Terriglobales bacterium]